jgi:hypothetical protein
MEYANGIRPYVLEWYHEVFRKAFDNKIDVDCKVIKRNNDGQEAKIYEKKVALTTDDLVLETKEVLGKIFTKKQILDSYTNPLINQGYIDSTESELDRRCNVYYPIIAIKGNKSLFDSDSSRALLYARFNDIREEEHTPSYGVSTSRMDFMIKEEEIVIETKMTRDGLKDKELQDQLIKDITSYQGHPDCKTLFIIVYDPKERIMRPHSLRRDLEKTNFGGLKVRLIISPLNR